MPKTNNTTAKANVEITNTENGVKTDYSKELQTVNEKNRELESKVDKLSTLLEKLLVKQEETAQKTSNEIDNNVNNTSNRSFNAYSNIEPTRRILLVNMVNAGGTYITHNNKSIRFDYFGHVQPVRFEDLESLVSKYRDYFENLEIRILDNEAIDALYLREAYNKYDISVEEMENIISLKPQDMIKKIQSLNTSLQESVLSLIIMNIAKNNTKYMDRNKWDVINNTFNINIQDFANKYLIK